MMNRKRMMIGITGLLLVCGLGGLLYWSQSQPELSQLSGDALVKEVNQRSSVSKEELTDLQTREEWEAVRLILKDKKIIPTPEQFATAVTTAPMDVIEAYFEQGLDPFEEVEGMPIITPLFSANGSPEQWELAIRYVEDERLLGIAVDSLNLEAVKHLLDQGYPIQDDESVLLQPVRHNQVELTRLLLDNGAKWTNAMEQTAKDYNSDLILKMGN
ncbi:hypothetical protein PTI97_04335 [Exiguobacterium marinum]|uniref:Ankyrin repeat-containing protein n=1 Tax=Exiguobacterium marinum TaxID=273528 RepID=A0ABY7X0V8_9BACL|nr:hypothetical protein [Exiguobacterium marinum]WDH76749.1 hypothetical protein PTI97_04335 [Exiguobacterium marinum]